MRSTHPLAARFVRQGLFVGLTTFSDFESRVRMFANTKEVGDAFEILVEAYLHTQPKMQATNVWLVGQVPLRIRKQLNLPSDSKGIDGIFQTRTGELVPYQVKYRTERDVLPYGEVSSFLGITERSCKDRLIFTNARGLAKDIENRDGLRSVRASHFHALTKDDFAAIEAWLTENPVRHERRQPRPYQQEAVQKLSQALRARSRATAVMACGTGKTLVALWVAESLDPKTVLVLVPSLALLSQTLPDWCRESKWGESFEYLCVCSDPTVSKGVDAYTIRPQDADFPITTDASEVRRFLDRKTDGVKVVFSTYQSAPVVAQGMKGLQPFDFGILDEAHKTTGPQAGLFSFGLTDKNLPIAKRLFLTATPRHCDIRRRDKEGDFRLVSMDDESVYGPVAYRLSFASAVKQGIICPYKIVISVTTKEEVDAHLLKHGITLVKRNKIQAQWVATQLALKRAIQKTKASKVITFHSRVALAEEFASDRSVGIRQYLKAFEVFHVNGGQSAAERESLLTDFKTSANGLITNARCLTEGVDVPAVDMVAFIDPRRSKVDIAQATGRAMRQSKATGKTTGYIVVPLFLEQRKGESEEQALKRSGFDDVALVIAAMQEQDEDLVDLIRELRQQRGELQQFNPRKLVDKLEVIGPAIELRELRNAVSVVVVERLGAEWDEMYGRLLAYARTHGDCRVPTHYKSRDMARLGTWVAVQRQRRAKMPVDRRRRLECLKGWEWSAFDARWEEACQHLEKYSETNGNCVVPADFHTKDGFPLGRWVAHQRRAARQMAPNRARRLEQLQGWTWSVPDERWEKGYGYLQQYVKATGALVMPKDYHTEDGYPLAIWVQRQRSKRSAMPDDRCRRLEAIQGWTWDPNESKWEEGCRHLREYLALKECCDVPARFETKDGFPLGKWIQSQRAKRHTMSKHRQQRLERIIGWTWSNYDARWNEGYRHLLEYVRQKRSCVMPADYVTKDGYPLAAWVERQRANRSEMSSDRVRLLEEIPAWHWAPRADAWERRFREFVRYCAVKEKSPIAIDASEQRRQHSWATKQRSDRAILTQDQQRRLESIDGWSWEPRKDAWMESFEKVRDFCDAHGACRFPAGTRAKDGFSYEKWVSKQRAKREVLTPKQRELLESLPEWSWDPVEDRWNASYEQLLQFANERGHCDVPIDLITETGVRLGQWVTDQRRKGRKQSPDRVAKLESVKGWLW